MSELESKEAVTKKVETAGEGATENIQEFIAYVDKTNTEANADIEKRQAALQKAKTDQPQKW